ncbi:hypothetical protein RB597_009098 [Gaeumannomyces tritici]
MPPAHPPIIEILDDDPAENENDRNVDRLIRLREEYGAVLHKPIKVEDDSGSDGSEGPVDAPAPAPAPEAVYPEAKSFIDLTLADDDDDDKEAVSRPRAEGPAHHRPLVRPLEAHQTRLNSCVVNGETIKEGHLVELHPLQDFAQTLYEQVEFLEVRQIFIDADNTILRGVPYMRTRNMNALLTRKRNEICRFIQSDEGGDEDQGHIDVGPGDVVGVRSFIITSAPWPEFRDLANDNLLICRWQFTITYACAVNRLSETRQKAYEMRHLRAADVPKLRYRRADNDNLGAWRGGKIPGGSYCLPEDGAKVEDGGALGELQEAGAAIRGGQDDGQRRQYAAADLFCGAGGTSCGMRAAGFRVEYAVDHWQHACATYEHNFPTTVLFQHEVFDFIQGAETLPVDILHLSPPCQFFSPAHTIEGGNDEVNSAALFSCKAAVEKLKPRVFTLEQTFGLASARAHKGYFAALIHGFTELGYSVRWSQIPLADWGLPQTRKRLIIIGACPGEPLPTFPEPSHGGMAARGTRRFTDRELACIQGFPIDFHFKGSCVKKQIGNAFPPSVVEHLFRHLREQLRRADGLDSDADGGGGDDDKAAVASGAAQPQNVKRRRRARSASIGLAAAPERGDVKKENQPPGGGGSGGGGAATPLDRPRAALGNITNAATPSRGPRTALGSISGGAGAAATFPAARRQQRKRRPETIDLTLIDDRPIPIRLSPVATRHPPLQQERKDAPAPVIIDLDTEQSPRGISNPPAAMTAEEHKPQEAKVENGPPVAAAATVKAGDKENEEAVRTRSSSGSSTATLLNELPGTTSRYAAGRDALPLPLLSPGTAELLDEVAQLAKKHIENSDASPPSASKTAVLGELTNITSKWDSSSSSSSARSASSSSSRDPPSPSMCVNAPSPSSGGPPNENRDDKNCAPAGGKKRPFHCIDLTNDD